MLLLENENAELQDKVGILTDIVVNMQKCLNHIDAGERNNNIIVSGLREEDIEVSANGVSNVFSSDEEKLMALLSKLEIPEF